MTPREPVVYFIKPVGLPGPIKIGFSTLGKARLMNISTWSPFPLEIVASAAGTVEIERAVHNCFAHCHSHREWFHAAPDLLAFIEKVRDGVAIGDAIDLSRPTGSVSRLKYIAAMARKGTSQETVSA